MRHAITRTLGLLVVAASLMVASPAAAATAAPVAAAVTPTPSESPSAGATDAEGGGGGSPTGDLIRARVRTDGGEDVAGATVTVEQDGEEVTSGQTDDRGTVELPLPGPGAYDVVLDVEDLPEDVADLVPRQETIATNVEGGRARTVAFRLQPEGTAAAGSTAALDRVPQLLVNGIRFGLVIALAAVGLSLIFGTTGLTNFAHSELVTFGALVALALTTTAGLPFLLAAASAVVISGAFGWANDRLLWQPLRRRGTGLIAMMIVSIGLSLFLRYLYLFFVGGSPRTFPGAGQGPVALPLGITLRPLDLITMGLTVVVLLVVALALIRTRLGKATRAVSDNPALASASGIDVDRVIRTVWIAGAALAGLAGIVLGLQQAVSFQMGFQILLLVFAAVTLGGLGTAFGALVGSLIVGVFVELSTLVIPSELRNVGALVILIVILLVRPQGILGRAQRVG